MKAKIILISLAAVSMILLVVGVSYWRASPARKAPVIRIAMEKPAVKKKRPAPPAPVKKTVKAKVAIVMDDFGYSKNNIETLFGINEPVTLSILPDLRYSREIASMARSRGCEAILHLPLEPHRKDVKEEADTIKGGMSDKEIVERLDKEMLSVPGLEGVSNHMGSKSTEDAALMSVILNHLKARGLYFFDSITSEKSVCEDIARSIGLRYAKRDIFLDNSTDISRIERQVSLLRKLALKRGRAIAVCHDRKNTVAVLAREMPEMAKEGIDFVPVSEMVRR